MTQISQLISDISATGARFVIRDDGVGLDRPIPAGLLVLARQNKASIHKELARQREATRQRGERRLQAAAQGLPINPVELLSFYAGDIMAIGAGEVSDEALAASVRCYAMHHVWHAPNEPDSRVKCSECKQDRCQYPLAYGRHGSDQPRWCGNYTPRGAK